MSLPVLKSMTLLSIASTFTKDLAVDLILRVTSSPGRAFLLSNLISTLKNEKNVLVGRSVHVFVTVLDWVKYHILILRSNQGNQDMYNTNR